MNNSSTTKKIKEFAKLAMDRLMKEDLAPTPENYELWYTYYAGANMDISRAIDVLSASGQEITEERCAELYQRFLSDRTENEEVRKAGDRIQETIQDVSGFVTSVKTESQKYCADLSKATSKLKVGMDQEELEIILRSITERTQKMITQNKALEEKLTQSSQVMGELQKNLEMVRREALTDGLTNLSNRKAFDTEIRRVVSDALESKKTFSVILLDIDYFKNFNDDYGHQVGDQVLRLVARTIKDGVKGRDMAARYGGEEFAVILPETGMYAAMKVGEHLREAVSNKEIINRNSGEKLGRITLSAGVAEYVLGEDIDGLVDRADNALYTAKHNGRNQVAAAPVPGDKKAAG